MPIAIARIRRAAKQLQAAGKDVTSRNLTKTLGISRDELLKLFRIQGLQEEIGFIAETDALRMRYTRAAERLRHDGKAITRRALAAAMGKSRPTVHMWLLRHKEFAATLCIVSAAEAARLERVAACTQMAVGLSYYEELVLQTAVTPIAQ